MHYGADDGGRLRDDPVSQPSRTYHARLIAKAEELGHLRHEMRVWAERHGADRTTADAVELACYEAMANVVMHAYGDDEGPLGVSATAYPDRLQVVVSDEGQWRNPTPQTHPDGGMGLDLISRLAHRANIDAHPDGTIVSMTWSR